jgi:DNA-binding GntR family transcriptional regulator
MSERMPRSQRALHLESDAKFFRVKRVRIADSVRMSIEESFLPAKLCSKLLETFDPRTSLYQALFQSYGIRMTAADEVAEAALAHTEESRLLKIKKGTPVFVLTRISYAENSQPVEFVRSIYRGDRWKLVSQLSASHKAGGNTITRTPVVAIAHPTLSQEKHKRGVGNGRHRKHLRQFSRKKGA